MTGRSPGNASIALVAATAVASWVALWSWHGFVQTTGTYLPALLLGIPLISTIGVLTRWARFPIVVVAAAQVLGILLFANVAWGSSLLPTPSSVDVAAQALANSVEAMRSYAAPIPRGVTEAAPVLVLGGMFCHLLVDLCAVTLGRVPVAGLPLLVIYTLPVSILDRSVSWLIFSVIVGFFLIMLSLQEGGRIARWGRQFGATPHGEDLSPFGGGQDARRHPAAVGATATALALFVPLLIPSLDLDLIPGNGPGGSGDREVRITNPMTDLRRDLVQGEDIPLVRVESPGPEPEYLRLSVLTTFNGQAWTPGDRDLQGDQGAEGDMPTPIGLDDTYGTDTRKWELTVSDDLTSWWLPTPMYVASIEAGPDWRYDADVLDFYTANKEQDTAGMSYSLTELIPAFTGEELADARPPDPDIAERYTALPQIPDEVTTLAQDLTEGFFTDYEKAQALQQYFRSGEFLYSTVPAAGNGNDALLQFLEDKEGYCEQFASAMAVMARALDIPARVAVGFFHADSVAEDEFEFSSKDLHAWPEIYFEGAGWVKFEPTPSTHIETVPGYTNDRIDDLDPGNDPSDSTTSAAPSSLPSSGQPSTAPTPEEAAAAAKDDDFSFVPFLWGGGALLLLIGGALAPRLLRRSRTARRWNTGSDPAEAAWAELRDVTLDVGRAWPAGRSPRATGRALEEFFGSGGDAEVLPRTGAGINPAATQSLARLVSALEQSRYAPAPEVISVDKARVHLDICTEALRAGVTQRARWRADWLPPSLFAPTSRSGRLSATGGRRIRTGPVDQIS